MGQRRFQSEYKTSTQIRRRLATPCHWVFVQKFKSSSFTVTKKLYLLITSKDFEISNRYSNNLMSVQMVIYHIEIVAIVESVLVVVVVIVVVKVVLAILVAACVTVLVVAAIVETMCFWKILAIKSSFLRVEPSLSLLLSSLTYSSTDFHSLFSQWPQLLANPTSTRHISLCVVSTTL